MIRSIVAGPLSLCIALALSAGAAAAADETGSVGGQLYVEVRGGMAAPQTLNLNDIDVGSQNAAQVLGVGDLQYHVGGAAAVAAGYQISNEFRTELEFAYGRAKYDEINYRDTANVPLSGRVCATTAMANLFYDIRMRADQPIVPYFGGGVGVGLLRYDPSFPGATGVDEHNVKFVWNAGFGLYWRIKDGFGITGGYRYVGSTKLDFETDTGEDVEMNFGMHETTLGVRFTF